MSANKLMKVSELANELGIDKITIEFWLKRFNKWLPHIIEENEKLYPMETFNKLVFIAERMNADMLPSEIENALIKKFNLTDNNVRDDKSKIDPTNNGKNTISNLSEKNLAELMKTLINTIGSNQERIAKAHEMRAKAEERKAAAIEKRAEAEIKKAIAMNNIADALQNMKHEVWPCNSENQIKGEIVKAISLDEKQDEEPESVETAYASEELDNLALLLDDNLDNDLEEENKKTNNKTETEVLDDLSLLIDDELETAPIISKDSDTGIIGSDNPASNDDIDDLSLLLDEEEKLDDLSLLLDEEEKNPKQDEELDNLALLLDDNLDNDLEEENKKTNNKTETLDDLSLLIDGEPEKSGDEFNLQPSVTLEENFDQYKSEVINNIIQLKKAGLSVEETTQRLNKAKVKTFSGKNRWSIKTISKIYKFIESVS